ncbi:TadE/TadG family type IV pilus assembly protein [Nonomuraea soli]|uniref:Flp pilus assembly protein TadG n=1 Tax=Nonomuraea soli TaxID=1032476 RepID=A0A7W0CJV2_9ACTN|nr:TadE family protein [Nonomuraea soli]MBA2892534.1 Flp pilus assembly protein TadG [Nonomuraea soli]
MTAVHAVGHKGTSCGRESRAEGAPARRGRSADRGSMAVETVMLAPVFLLFLMFLVGAGRLVEAQGEVSGAARDAARAASVQRTMSDAEQAAQSTATHALEGRCVSPQVSLAGSRWEEGGQVTVRIACELDLGFLGFTATKELTGTSVVPLETFRRVE